MALLAYNRKKQFLAPDVEGLIEHLTHFKENDKNYQEVAKFVYSNIIHHNFATVDISTVQRSIEGIVEKFKVHGLSHRSRRLQELVNKYVSSDSSNHSQLIVQWHVLLLLLSLSYKPLSVSEDELKAIEDVTEPSLMEEDINWSEYLREGWEQYQCPSDNSDYDTDQWLSESDDGEIEEPPPCSHMSHMPRAEPGYSLETQGYGVVPHPSLWRLQPPPLSRKEALRKIIREAAESEQWLRKNVQNSWWCDPSFKSVSQSRHLQNRVCEIWEKHMATKHTTDSYSPPQSQVVSEYKVLYEVLWMLQVPTDKSLFRLDGQGLFYVKPNLSLSSTVPDTLRLVLEGLCPYFNIINELKKFEEEVNKQEMGEKPPPITYKAYSTAISQKLYNFTKLVISIEERLNNQDERMMTLVSVMEELTPGLNIVHYLYDIHTQAVSTDWRSQPPWLCATRLLSVLYEALLEATEQLHLEASLDIFIHSFHVYLNIIDVWLSEGRLEDWRSEFLVRRVEGELQVMPYKEEMKKCGVVPVSLLSKLVTVVRDAGHTMEVVSQLNNLAELRGTVKNKGCLFKEFSENVYNEIKRLKGNIHVEPDKKESSVYVLADDSVTELEEKKNSNVVPSKKLEESDFNICNLVSANNTSPRTNKTFVNLREGESQRCYLLALSNDTIYDQTMRALLDNPLLNEAMHSYFPPGEPTTQQPSRAASPQPETDQSSVLVCLMSMHSVLERQLGLITTRHGVASRLVTQTLRNKHNLLQHFTALRTVFFMEAGNLAQSFYSYLFKEIESGMWNNPLNLSVQLQLCVEEFYPGFGNFFSVLIKSGNLTTDVHRAIPAISLAYRVDWPVSLVITQEAIESYNKVFKFLLHLKYAFWTLHNIRFSDLYHSLNTLRVRRLHVLKLWIYHSTNTLHSYFMGLVLRSFSMHLEQSIQLADSIDVIIQAHNKFLDEVKVHCLQDEKTHVEKFIMKLLRLCSSLSDCWQSEAAGTLTDEEMCTLEQQYMGAYRGLVHVLEVVTVDANPANFLNELKSEISHSLPEPCYVETVKSSSKIH